MNKRSQTRRHFRASTAAVAFALLLGCGGGGDGVSPTTEQPQSVQLRETATVLSVTTEMPASSGHRSFEARAMNFAFEAKVDGGPLIAGRLELKGEREDDGVIEVEGRLFPDVDPSLPTPSDLKNTFDNDRRALQSAMREDIKVLGEELRAAIAAGTPHRDALAAFKAKFEQRMAKFRADVSALVAEFRAMRRARGGDDDDDDNAAKGFEVHGTIAADGSVDATIDLGAAGQIHVTGKLSSDTGSASGEFTGPASGDKGTWTAKANAGTPPPSPPPSNGGNAEAGLAKYNAACAGCHSAGKIDTTSVGEAGDLAKDIDDIVSDLGRIDSAMKGLTLSAQDILDLKAFLRQANNPPSPGPIDGAALYAGNCSVCHGPLATSTKLGRTAAQIQTAIGAVPQMAGLSSLTSEQVAAIAAALVTPPTNQAPTITSTAVTSATVGVAYSYDVNATDPNSGDTLTYSLTAPPTGMTINASTGMIAWTPTAAGNQLVTVRVADQGGLAATQAFTINVASAPPTNQAPTITSTAVTSATVGVAYSYDVNATDPNSGDTLTYSLTAPPTGMTINASTGMIAWMPTAAGNQSVTVRVVDQGGLAATQAFTINVASAPPTNQAPTITSTAVTSATVGVAYSYDVNATDPNSGDTLTYSLTAPPTGMTINASTGMIAWTPTAAGNPSVTVRVVDQGGLAATQAFTINVATAPPAGNFANGQALFGPPGNLCAGCHKAGTTFTAGPFSNLKGQENKIIANIGSLNGAMSTIRNLTAQEVLDLKVFLSQVP